MVRQKQREGGFTRSKLIYIINGDVLPEIFFIVSLYPSHLWAPAGKREIKVTTENHHQKPDGVMSSRKLQSVEQITPTSNLFPAL